MDRTHFIYPIISWWAFGLFPLWGYYNNNAIMSIYVKVGFFGWTYVLISRRIFRSEISGLYANSMCNYLRDCLITFLKVGLNHYPNKIYMWQSIAIPFKHLLMVGLPPSLFPPWNVFIGKTGLFVLYNFWPSGICWLPLVMLFSIFFCFLCFE